MCFFFTIFSTSYFISHWAITEWLTVLSKINMCKSLVFLICSVLFCLKGICYKQKKISWTVPSYWILSHCGIQGNEKANKLARKSEYMRPYKSAFQIGKNSIKNIINFRWFLVAKFHNWHVQQWAAGRLNGWW